MANTDTTRGLIWRRIGAGAYEARRPGLIYKATRDHRPGVDFWRLTCNGRSFGTFTTLRAAKQAADSEQAAEDRYNRAKAGR